MSTILDHKASITPTQERSDLYDYFFSRIKTEALTPELVSTLKPCEYFMRLKTDHPNFFSWEIRSLNNDDPKNYILETARKEKLLSPEEINIFLDLKKRGLDVALLTLREVPQAGLIVVRAPVTDDESKSTCSDVLKHRIVGCVIDGSFVDELHMEGEFRKQIHIRNKSWRSSVIRGRLMRLTPQESVELFVRGTKAHRMSILTGFLAGYAPNEAYFEIAKDVGSINIGGVECGYSKSKGIVEVALPPINFRFNTYTYGQGEKRFHIKSPNEHSTELQCLCVQGKNALKEKIESLSGVKVNIEERVFIASHNWEGEKFASIIISYDEKDEGELINVLKELNKLAMPS